MVDSERAGPIEPPGTTGPRGRQLLMSDSTAISPLRGYSIERWQPFTVAEEAHARYLLVAEPDQPVDSMRFTYLEAEIESESEAGARLRWETADGERVHGPLLEP